VLQCKNGDHEHSEPRPVGRRWMPNSAARGFPEDLGSEGSAPGQGGTRDEHALHVRTECRATRVSCGVGKQRGVEVACTLWAPEL
jgi:hypothetical protein